jgi:hypothetical protein
MKPARAPVFREALRGDEPDEVQLIADDGAVLVIHAHGLHRDEQFRVREAVLQLLKSAATRGQE